MSDDSRVSAEIPDWSREAIRGPRDAGPKLLRALRRYQAARTRPGVLARLRSRYWAGVHGFWSLLTQCEIHLTTRIGGGLRLPHPNGIILHPGTEIGPNCMIFQQVTVTEGVRIGGHVDIGAGARLIGPLSVGEHARIGANAVVTGDVAPGDTVVGVPARPLVR